MTRARFLFVCCALFVALGPSLVIACPACYGAADNTMIDGMNTAIMTMVGIVGFVLSGFVAFFVMLRRRMMRMDEMARPAPPQFVRQ